MTEPERLTIGIDVGGTSIRAAVVDGTGTIVDSVRAATPASAGALEDALEETVRYLSERNDVAAVGLAVAGFLAVDRRTVLFAPHLAWVDAPVAQRFTDRFAMPVVLEHDANAAAWAEYRFGAAAGAHTVVLVAL
ncbi:ROK family protein, partial [Rhodococcus sp. CX]